MAHLQIVVIDNQPHKPVQELFALSLRQAIDMLNMMANCKHGFPPRHWIGADDGVLCDELFAHVLGRASFPAVEFEAVLISGLVELWLRIRRG